MLVKRPGDIRAGDRVFRWHPQAWVTVTRVERRGYGTAMLHLCDGSTVEAYTKKLIR
jgi:hypothetical protein